MNYNIIQPYDFGDDVVAPSLTPDELQ
jgi:hypothetical protein